MSKYSKIGNYKIKGTIMIQIACYNSAHISINEELKANYFDLKSEKEASEFTGPLIIGLDQQNLDRVKQIISARKNQVVISIKSKKDFNLIPEFKSLFSKIFGFIDLNSENDMAIPLLMNYINQNFSKETLQLQKHSNALSVIEESTRSELRGLKELHDRFVKMRTEKLKGVELAIKFMAGERSGGEFFDYITRDSQMLFIQAGSDSYVVSSLIISALEDLKIKNADFYSIIESFISLINQHAKDNKAKVSYTIMILKLKNMEATIYGQGNSKLFYNNEIINLGKSSILQLGRGSKVTFLSEGTIINWAKSNEEEKLVSFLNSNLELNTRDFINEIFFELARHKKGMFLYNDALVTMLEIDENILLQL